MKKIFFLLIFFSIQFTVAQTIEKKFVGCWAQTLWIFEFFKNGEFKRMSTGHFGNTTYSGKYAINNDTIKLTYSTENNSKTSNEYYFIDKNNILIDYELQYGYPIYKSENESVNCGLKYPRISPVNKEKIIQLEKAINLAYNSDKMKAYYHFDTKPKRKLLVSKYHALQANIIVDHKVAEFRAIEEITEDFYIEFEDFDLNYSDLNFTIKIHGEGVKIDFTFVLTDKEWVIKETRIFEE